ncbi:MAG: hypothetical protein LUD81_02185, partial [Clostridiales bacterium]|nr:hypothetical protein [Clostridiales bacterium]
YMALNKNGSFYIDIIGRAFDTFFNLNYYFCGGQGKSSILENYPHIYYKWLSAVISDKLPVTPYGLISEVSKRDSEKGCFFFPYIKPNSFLRFKNFKTEVIYHSFEDHPVIKDLESFLKIVSKSERILKTKPGEIILDKAETKALKKALFTYSPYYIEYLFELGVELKLIRDFPSINIRVFRASPDYQTFFKKEDIFKKIFDASVRLCRNNLNQLFPPESPFFTADLIEGLISHPTETGSILSFILSDYEMYTEFEDDDDDEYSEEEYPDIEDMSFEDETWLEESLGLSSGEGEMLMTSAYVLSVMLSKWFFTVFGFYLNLIRPCGGSGNEIFYGMHFFVQNRKHMDYSQKEAVFTLLPEGYNLTSFGLAFFKGSQNSFSVENEVLSKLSLKNTFEDFADLYGVELTIPEDEENTADTYVLRIYNEDRKRPTYKYFEFTEYSLLNDVCAVVSTCFRIKNIRNFSIFTDESRSPFSEYTSILSEGRTHKKAEATFFNEVFSKNGDKIWLKIVSVNKKTGEKVFNFAAEVVDIGKKQRGRDYPVEREEIK